jgi:hypothetical protein
VGETRRNTRRRFIALLAGVALALGTAGQAAAFHCFVVKKPTGAGSAATINFDVVTDPDGEPDFDTLPFNPNSGRVNGGFVTLRITAAGALSGPGISSSRTPSAARRTHPGPPARRSATASGSTTCSSASESRSKAQNGQGRAIALP